jgi:hypothetical protein
MQSNLAAETEPVASNKRLQLMVGNLEFFWFEFLAGKVQKKAFAFKRLQVEPNLVGAVRGGTPEKHGIGLHACWCAMR